jgi:hypothetical protein
VTDWTELAYKLGRLQLAMRADGCELQAEEFLGESLRRLLEAPGSGFVTSEYCDHVLDMNRKVDRANGERAQETLKRESAEYARKMAASARVYAEAIRIRAQREIPSRYRREGALIAAGWLDPGHKHAESGEKP